MQYGVKLRVCYQIWLKFAHNKAVDLPSRPRVCGAPWARAANFVKKPPFIVNITNLELDGFNASIWVSWSPSDPKKSQCIEWCIQIHQMSVNKHGYDIHIKFEVSLHFWPIWPRVVAWWPHFSSVASWYRLQHLGLWWSTAVQCCWFCEQKKRIIQVSGFWKRLLALDSAKMR